MELARDGGILVTGALVIWLCPILHPVFKGLNLGYPSKVEASSTMLLTDCAPTAQMVKFTFPARQIFLKVAMPEVEVYLVRRRSSANASGRRSCRKEPELIRVVVLFSTETKDTLICGLLRC